MVISVKVKVNQDIGRLFENAIFLQLRRITKEIFYYKKEFECDFVIRHPNQEFECFHVCYHFHIECFKKGTKVNLKIAKQLTMCSCVIPSDSNFLCEASRYLCAYVFNNEAFSKWELKNKKVCVTTKSQF